MFLAGLNFRFRFELLLSRLEVPPLVLADFSIDFDFDSFFCSFSWLLFVVVCGLGLGGCLYPVLVFFGV